MRRPPPHIDRQLKAYDPELRCRWARHQALWAIEKRLPPRHRQYMAEMPNPQSADDRTRDLYDGWHEGYVLVMFVHPALLGAPVMWDTLATADLHRQGGVDKFSALLEEQDRAREAAVTKTVRDHHGDLADDMWHRIAWLDGRRQVVPNLEPVPARYAEEARDGYTVVDRRRRD